MSSKTRSSHREPVPAGKPGKKKKAGRPSASDPTLKELGSELDLRFNKYFVNIMIPVLGIMSLLTLVPQLSAGLEQDLYYWIKLVYNSICIALCLIAFPGMRNKTANGWKATIALLVLNALYSLSMVVYSIAVLHDTVQTLVAAASILLFVFIIPYYSKRKSLFSA
jgi:cation transport ATPase